MMYISLLTIHSLLRWVVLLSILFTIFRAYSGWMGNKPYQAIDKKLRLITTTTLHIQLIVGLWLYFISPVITYFMGNFKDAVHQRQIRFFGMEHSIMMLVAIVIMTIGSAKAKRKATDADKFKTTAIWFTIGLIIILLSIPWPFSGMASRPYFRGF